MSQPDDKCQEAKSQQIEKILWRKIVLQFNLYIRIKGGEIRGRGYMKFIVDRLRKQEKAK